MKIKIKRTLNNLRRIAVVKLQASGRLAINKLLIKILDNHPSSQ